ncbi:MAG TPA: flagellar basal body P-ring protein FlgI [Burkholderiaceae bacterium]|nr:flagellar basal body P-ring protein FlgI [Burkholderiaceae bacterium]
MRRTCLSVALLLVAAAAVNFMSAASAYAAVRIKDLARFDGVHEQPIIGYGLVVGLSGTGDSQRSQATLQSVSNMLREFGLTVPPYAVTARNVAAVIVTADMPGAVRTGDRFDVNVAALGDARSLAGGTLLMTPLMANNKVAYAMAQGPLAVGGYKFEQRGTSAQKNFPTAGTIPEGAIAQRSLAADLGTQPAVLELLLDIPDYTTANRVAAAINLQLPGAAATALDAGRVHIDLAGRDRPAAVALMSSIESIAVDPDIAARVVVNERTGTVVSGGDVYLSAVTVTHGDLRVSITERLFVSQPENVAFTGLGVRTVARPEATVRVEDDEASAVSLPSGATIADLVDALRSIKVSSRDVIAILQGIKRAGALHAELVIQ